MKKLLTIALLLFSRVVFAQNDNVIPIQKLIDNTIEDASSEFVGTDWKFLSVKKEPNSTVKRMIWGYNLKMVNQKPQAQRWLDLVVSENKIVEIIYEFSNKDIYNDMVDEAIGSGAVKSDTKITNKSIVVKYISDDEIYLFTTKSPDAYASYVIDVQKK